MTPNEMLLQKIRERTKSQSFDYGILTADRYVKTLQECIGSDLCYRYASTKSQSFSDVMEKAAKTLTFNDPGMVLEEELSTSSKILDAKGNPIDLPKNTLLVFRHVLTTSTKDRDGDVMRTSGAQPDPNMLLLWQHVHTLPIGKMLAVWNHNSKTLTVISAVVDINELAHDSCVMIENKMGRFSHGFRAIDFREFKEFETDPTSPGGFDIKAFEIMEESLVSVPSNKEAKTEEILISLVQNRKMTSPMMKAYAKEIDERRVKSHNVPVDINLNISLNGESVNGNKAKPTKCAGDAGCGCGCGGRTPKEADGGVAKESNSREPETMTCPKCGGALTDKRMCRKCGYTMKDEPEKSVEGVLEKGLFVGSWEGYESQLRDKAHEYLLSKGVESIDTMLVATFPSYVILSAEKEVGVDHYQVVWQIDDSHEVSYLGAPVKAQIKASPVLMEKVTSAVQVKYGRRVSKTTASALKSVKEDVAEVHEKERLMSRGGQALCKRAIKTVEELIDTAVTPQDGDEDRRSVRLTTKQAMAEFLSQAGEEDLENMEKSIKALQKMSQQQKKTEEFRALMGDKK